MKKILNLILIMLIGFSAFPQGSIEVNPNYGGIVAAQLRQRVIDSSGVYYPNVSPHNLDKYKSYGIIFNNYLTTAGGDDGSIMSQVPTDGTGDFDWARSTTKSRTNVKGEVVEVAIDYGSMSFSDGVGAWTPEDLAEQLLTYPVSFGNSYWTKSGATIEGDASTAGSELVTDGNPFVAGSWSLGIGATVIGGKLDLTGVLNGVNTSQNNVVAIGGFYKLTYTISGFSAGSIRVLLGSTGVTTTATSDGVYTLYGYAEGDVNLYIQALGTTTLTVDNISVKEVQGYPSPSTLDDVAYKLVEDGSTGEHRIYTTAETTVTADSDISISVFAKANGKDWIQMRSLVSPTPRVSFDVSNGTVGTAYNGAIGTITAMANGWYRCSITYTISGGGTKARQQISLADGDGDSNVSYIGDGTSGVYIFLANLTEEDYASSPIVDISGGVAVEGSTVTRVADVVNGATYSGSQTSGVFYANMAAGSDAGTVRTISINSGIANDAIRLEYIATSNTIRALIKIGGATISAINFTVSDVTDFHKVAVRWGADGSTIFVDGVEGVPDTDPVSFAATPLTTISMDWVTSQSFYGKLKELGTLNYLTDEKMVQLTTQ